MRVSDLGPPLVLADGDARALSGPRQVALLSMFAMRANQRVGVDQLVLAGWGYDAGVSASTVENHIWRLRRVLEPMRSGTSPTVLVHEHGGYRLQLPPDALDSAVFEALAADIHLRLADGDAAEAIRLSDRALALWRGAPYEAIAHVSVTSAVVGRLEELRGQIAEQRIDALMRLGELPQALADLVPLIERNPFRERLRVQRMTALARLGRGEEALAGYREARSLMIDELGLEPGPELQALQREIIAQHSTATPVRAAPRRSVPLAGVHLPKRSSRLLGREREMTALAELLRSRPLVTIAGPGGSGKTRLAIELAHAAAGAHPDGVWFVDLTEVRVPDLVVDAVVSALGVTADVAGRGEDAAIAALAEFARDRSLLLVIDNCEHVLDGVARTVDALTAEGTASVVLATSREPIQLDEEAVWRLAPLSLEPSVEGAGGDGLSDAARLFVERMPPDGAGRLDPEDLVLVARICAAIDGLPLAIELAAARSGAFALSEIVDQVTRDPSRLSRVGRDSPDHRSTLWSTIEWSHDMLGPDEQAVHRRLAVLPGPFTLPLATAVAQGDDLDVAEIPGILARLVHRSLLAASPAAGASRASTFHQLDTVRAHARRRLDGADETPATLRRRDEWVRDLLQRRPRLGDAAGADWYDLLDDAYPSVRATLYAAIAGEPDLDLVRHGAALLYYWYYRGRLIEGRRWLESAAEAVVAEAGGEAGSSGSAPEATILRIALAGAALLSGQAEVAPPLLDAALSVVAGVPERYLVDLGEALVGAGNSAWARNEYGEAQRIATALHGVAERSGDPRLALLADEVACVAGLTSREPAQTAAMAESIYARAIADGDLLAQWTSCGARMIVSALTGDPAGGIVWIDRLIPAHVRFGSGGGGAFLEALANFASLAADPELAIRMYAAAWAEIRRVGMVWPVQLHTTELLDRARGALGEERFGELWDEGQALSYEDAARARELVAE